MFRALHAWPRRRWVAVVVLTPVVAAVLLAAGLPDSGGVPPVWTGVALLAAVLGAVVLASYLPAAGWSPDVGCTPCAAMSALTVVGATMAMRNYGTEIAGPLVAVAVLLFGLTQRLSQPATCATPAS